MHFSLNSTISSPLLSYLQNNIYYLCNPYRCRFLSKFFPFICLRRTAFRKLKNLCYGNYVWFCRTFFTLHWLDLVLQKEKRKKITNCFFWVFLGRHSRYNSNVLCCLQTGETLTYLSRLNISNSSISCAHFLSRLNLIRGSSQNRVNVMISGNWNSIFTSTIWCLCERCFQPYKTK